MLGDGKERIDKMSTSEGHCSRFSYFEREVKGQNACPKFHGLEDGKVHPPSPCSVPDVASGRSHITVDTIDSDLQGNKGKEEPFLSETGWFEKDEPVAVWVKCKGIWQAGIRCARADWPLATVKEKPAHNGKKFFVVFFPRTRNYSWADVLLVRPICELPLPIPYSSHEVGVKMVKDLTISCRFMMQKISVSMLNVIYQLRIEALSKSVRNVMVLKEFALDASRCKSYSDLGKMLLKLQSMIMQCYLKRDWLQHPLHLWSQQCQNAQSAESIEFLVEELNDSILWNEVHSLPSAHVKPNSNSEWKTWKHEVMKWFSTYHPSSSSGNMVQPSSDSPTTSALDISRKRPKLEIRRAEPNVKASHQKTFPAKFDSQFFDGRHAASFATSSSKPSKENIFREGRVPSGPPLLSNDVGKAHVSELVPKKPLNNGGNRYRQCMAFIEAKGRQCVRWASDGDVYCCVHQASRFVSSSPKLEGAPRVDAPLCEGITIFGNRCKHRSLSGSSFCKKHGPKSDLSAALNSPDNKLKRKHEENICGSESTVCKDIVLVEKAETPLQVDPVSFMEGEVFNETAMSEFQSMSKITHCIGSFTTDGNNFCLESSTRHSLYCENHLPIWLKRARNGKSRIISKEVFVDLLKVCCSWEQKLQLHQACDLFYRLLKSILSLRNPVPKEVQMQWAISEASKDLNVREFLTKLVCSEKSRLKRLWGFNADTDVKRSTFPMPLAIESEHDIDNNVRCKICSEKFHDEQSLGTHWMENHKKEAQWLFRGYVCAVCLDSFTNKKVLVAHVQERHHVEFVEQCLLFQCIPCGNHFGNTDQLWVHVLSSHLADLRQSTIDDSRTGMVDEDSMRKPELDHSTSLANNLEVQGCLRKFMCRFCGLKFNLLPDLGRHHQAAHMGPNSAGRKSGIRLYAYRLKSGRLSRPRYKKILGAASCKIRNRISATVKKRIQASNSGDSGTEIVRSQSLKTDTGSLGNLSKSQCSAVARIIFSEIHKTRPRPSNLEILSVARSACCREDLRVSLEGKYGVLPEHMYLKAAKLCSEHNVQVNWHQEGFLCPKRCKSVTKQHILSPLLHRSTGYVHQNSAHSMDRLNDGLEMDECHYVIDSCHFGQELVQKSVILCSDISFGKESVPIVCVVDKELTDFTTVSSVGTVSDIGQSSMPWGNFTYIVKSLVDRSLDFDMECPQLGCACEHSTCHPETCDHVYLFNTDFENARDISGKTMHGRFPHDDLGRIIFEEGYLVYECNDKCSCGNTCKNRVLQKGVNVKLEVFKTEKKGWAVRAGKAISRGMFICEYLGEVLSEHEANKRRNSYGKDGCSYLYEIEGHEIEGQVPYVIDATKYGSVSRFINHSCLPNLVSHRVLVESMDYPLTHIGLYAGCDLAEGEELTFDYQYKLLPGEGCPCHCGSAKCRGRLY